MAWVAIPNNPNWEYNNDPTDPGATNALRGQWVLSSNGVRQQKDGTQVYVQVRRVGDTADANRGELSKSFWDARGDEDDIETDMILVFRTTTANEEVRIGAAQYYENSQSVDYDASIDWGDGTTSAVTGSPANNAGLLHTFASAGDYTVRVSGPGFHKVNFYPGSISSTAGGNTEAQTDKLISVLNFGDVGHKTLRHAFYRTRYMTNFTLGHTDLSNCNDMRDFFSYRTWNMNANAVPLTVDLTNFDVSGLRTNGEYPSGTTMKLGGFFKASGVNMNTLNLTGINTTGVTSMNSFFYNISGQSTPFANALNLTTIDVRPLNTSSVTSFTQMFGENETLTSITGIEDMDVSSGTYFAMMFYNTGLTGSLDISSWDFSSAINYHYMFYSSDGLTDIIGIENINVTKLNTTQALIRFLTGVTLPTSRYDQFLINLAAQDKSQTTATQTADFGNSRYTAGGAAEAARTSLITNDGYTITDGGPV